MADAAKVEIKIKQGRLAIPRGVRINGVEVPNLREATVHYQHGDARKVCLEILATDVIEVDEDDWEPTAT